MSELATSFGTMGVSVVGADKAATPILFLHGVGSDKSVWRPQLDHFGRQRLAIAVDYPGYGESAPRAGADRDDFARAALATLDALGARRAHVCGLSLGGVVALAIHAIAADRCASLILADSFAVHPDGAAICQRAIDATAAGSMAALAQARAPLLLGAAGRNDPALVAEIVATMGRIDPAAYRQGAEAVWLADQSARAVTVDVPTLVIVGSEDAITPPALSRQLCGLIRGARLVEIAGAGHLSNIEAPSEFNREVDDFLAGIDE